MNHIPILCEELSYCLTQIPSGHVIDCTFGMGGHSRIFLDYNWKVTAFDRDESVKQYLPNHSNFNFINDKFSNINKYNLNADLIFADLGMSTMQLTGNRGFSYLTNDSLNMCMGFNDVTAVDILNNSTKSELLQIFKNGTDLPNVTKYANNIEQFRCAKKILTTFDLRDALNTQNYSVLSQCFQAIRIACNNEIYELSSLLKNTCSNMMIITFHSDEDRPVKHNFEQSPFFGYFLPSEDEIKNNIKSRSAKLRFKFKNSFIIPANFKHKIYK